MIELEENNFKFKFYKDGSYLVESIYNNFKSEGTVKVSENAVCLSDMATQCGFYILQGESAEKVKALLNG